MKNTRRPIHTPGQVCGSAFWVSGGDGYIPVDDRTRQRGYFNVPVVEGLWREHIEGRHVWDGHLWLLLNLELWHRIYLDGEGV